MKAVRSEFACICLAALLLGGCAARLPQQTSQLSGAELKQAEERLSRFLSRSCVEAVDSDVRLTWRAYAQQETYPASVQAAAPALLRLSLNDPLGRPLFLLAADEKRFTLADNQKSQGYTGSTELRFVRRFLPTFIPVNDLFFWLSARVRPERMQAAAVRVDRDGGFWWHGGSPDGKTVHILALDAKNRLSRHLIADKQTDEILFEARYSDYLATTSDCAWPGRIELSGKSLEADYAIEFSEIFSFAPIDRQRFQITLPPHFTVKEMSDKD
ncbi:lipoprotein insertase outer membrane protein LolB [Candidatus Electronema sp. TJ]|uniref:lipoprotein insertase outer membrane protein LolB n=1 Tax=Candidatus Electronema sp. TJ TaxID=3401573 RepID=UPI003AA96DC4